MPHIVLTVILTVLAGCSVPLHSVNGGVSVKTHGDQKIITVRDQQQNLDITLKSKRNKAVSVDAKIAEGTRYQLVADDPSADKLVVDVLRESATLNGKPIAFRRHGLLVHESAGWHWQN